MSFDRDKKMEQNLTTGSITGKLLLFAVPLMIGNVLQQFYNVVDTWVVGKYIGSEALAAVGSAYTLMTFLTSVILGLCMGSSAYFAMQYGSNCMESLKKGIFCPFPLFARFRLSLRELYYGRLIILYMYSEFLWKLRIFQGIILLLYFWESWRHFYITTMQIFYGQWEIRLCRWCFWLFP